MTNPLQLPLYDVLKQLPQKAPIFWLFLVIKTVQKFRGKKTFRFAIELKHTVGLSVQNSPVLKLPIFFMDTILLSTMFTNEQWIVSTNMYCTVGRKDNNVQHIFYSQIKKIQFYVRQTGRQLKPKIHEHRLACQTA